MGDRLTDGLSPAAIEAVEDLPDEERALLDAILAAEREELRASA